MSTCHTMYHIHAPENYTPTAPVVFLAGSIEMGAATHWQERVAAALASHSGTLLNPRRDNWDADVGTTADDPRFRAQVEWELAGLDCADIIFLYLDPATRAPISLLELGLHTHSGKLIVVCPPGYFRHGNVVVTCQRYGVPVYETLDAGITQLTARFDKLVK